MSRITSFRFHACGSPAYDRGEEVRSDSRGMLSLNGSFVIVNNGNETFFTGNDPGYAITGVTKKVSPGK